MAEQTQASAGCCSGAETAPVAPCAPKESTRLNTLEYNPALCINCGMCSIVCPHGVFAPNGQVAQLVRWEACMECGACQLNCRTGAISVDSGAGCVAAMINAALTGRGEVCCGPDTGSGCC